MSHFVRSIAIQPRIPFDLHNRALLVMPTTTNVNGVKYGWTLPGLPNTESRWILIEASFVSFSSHLITPFNFSDYNPSQF